MTIFTPGRIYHRRSEIHGTYAGQQQGGIATPANYPFIFLFTGDTGSRYGYDHHDGWRGNSFHLTGEGQKGDQQFTKGNLAIRDHIDNSKDLYLFTYDGMKPGYVRFVGQMVCTGYTFDRAPDLEGKDRQVIVFQLSPAETIEEKEDVYLIGRPLTELRRLAVDASNASRVAQERTILLRKRSAIIKSYALARANGFCEGCEQEAPFRTANGAPFLEVHHVHKLSDGGPDAIDAVVAICPNCHRRAHYAHDSYSYYQRLIAVAKRKASEVG